MLEIDLSVCSNNGFWVIFTLPVLSEMWFSGGPCCARSHPHSQEVAGPSVQNEVGGPSVQKDDDKEAFVPDEKSSSVR